MAYYHDLITEKSWRILQELKRQYQFILIGGWAVYLHASALKSKDIDIIVSCETLEKFRGEYELIKNDRLKKYEIHIEGIDVDIYVPFFSDLGILVEDITKNTLPVAGLTVPVPEILLLLKLQAWLERSQSLKGEKDKLDILALLRVINFERYRNFVKEYGMESYAEKLKKLVADTRSAPELDINEHQFSKLKTEWLHQL